MKRWTLILILSACSFNLRVAAEQEKPLKRGINASHWFAQSRDYSPERIQSHTTREDIRLIRQMGFDHIRLSVNPELLYDREEPAALHPDYLALLDRAIEGILEEGLAVIFDIHPQESFKKEITGDQRNVERFARFWQALSRHLSRYGENQMFLEVINEPQVEDTRQWQQIQQSWASAIRRGAPDHTIILTGARWSSPSELVQLAPIKDPNVIYNFHFYEPHSFTHQGAGWGADFWPAIRGLPYPVHAEEIRGLAEGIEDSRARAAVLSYLEQGWDAARVRSEVERTVRWAETHQVQLLCNEFGVYRRYAPPGSRTRWLRDLREALESFGIGWTMWDYQGGFSVVNQTNGRKEPDLPTLEALGLKRAERAFGAVQDSRFKLQDWIASSMCSDFFARRRSQAFYVIEKEDVCLTQRESPFEASRIWMFGGSRRR